MSEERRIVTVLFADVAGSTAMGEELDPEDVRALLARYYGIAQDVVAEHGGTLEKFIGDAVMAVFGLPVAHGDDAERAVAAALTLRDRVRADERLGERLAVRFGLSTGEVVASRDPSAGDFLVTGDAVNVAARMQQAADPWQVLVTERTAHAAAARFDFSELREVEARGKSRPVGALGVVGRRAAATGLPGRLPLIGRADDMEQLQLVARRAFGDRRPSLVSIIAPAGTGKTRLLEEFLEWLPSRDQPTQVAIAQCLPYGRQLTYWPMRQVLFTLIGVGEDASPPEVRSATAAWLVGIGADAGSADLLAATIGMGEVETTDRALIFAAWRDALEAAGRAAPLLIVFEDLHWSSDSLLDLVEFLMQPRGEAPLMMIALTRPELLDRRPTWGGGRRNHVALSLEPLTDGATAELVRHLLEADRPELVEQIVTRSEGNPFYAGELVRSSLEGGPGDRLPDTVQGTVLARLDLLPAHERRVLQVGSVFGRSFRAEGISSLEPSLDVTTICESLAARDLIRAGPGDRYTFRHILIREVAYGTLPRAERARLHAAAGDWMEARSAGREVAVAEIIALHFHEAAVLALAIDPGSAETERLRARASRWLTQALEVAAAVEAQPEAIRHGRAAIALGGPPIELARLHERIGDLQFGDAGVAAYDEALALYEAAGASAADRLRTVAGSLMSLMRMQGSIANRPSADELNRRRARGAALVEQTDDADARAYFWAADAFYPFWLEMDPLTDGVRPGPDILAAAERSAQLALETAEAIDDPNLISAALDAQGGLAGSAADWQLSARLSERRLEFKDRLSMLERGDAVAMAARSYIWLGDLAGCDRVTEAGLDGMQAGVAPAPTLHMLCWRLYVLTLLGRWADVPRLAAFARRCWAETGQEAGIYALAGFLAALDVARARQDRPSLDATAGVIAELLGKYRPEHPGRIHLRHAAGDPVLDGSWPLISVTLEERRLSLASDLGLPIRQAESFLATATANGYGLIEMQCRRNLGLTRSEPAELATALAVAERLGAEPTAGRLTFELGRLTGDSGLEREGRERLERLGDRDYLERHA